MTNIKDYADTDSVGIFVIGNKTDLIDERQVSREEAEKLAKGLGIPYYETSAKDGSNVEEIFAELSKEMIKKNSRTDEQTPMGQGQKIPIETIKQNDQNFNLESLVKKPRKKKCC